MREGPKNSIKSTPYIYIPSTLHLYNGSYTEAGVKAGITSATRAEVSYELPGQLPCPEAGKPIQKTDYFFENP